MSRLFEKIISIPAWIIFLPCVPVLTHWSMTKNNYYVKRLKRASYLDIKGKMLSIDWTYNSLYPHSLFDRNNYHENYFHASIFRFGDVGYLLTPYGYYRACILQKKIRKSIPEFISRDKQYID